jgi:hypothetical protein
MVTACKKQEPQPRQQTGSGSAGLAAPSVRNRVARADFNRIAVELNLPVYWIADANHNQTLDADEFATLLFYPASRTPPTLDGAYEQVLGSMAAGSGGSIDARRKLVRQDLAAGRPTLVMNDFTASPAEEQAFVKAMLVVADRIDQLYDRTTGAEAARAQVAPDPESQSLFRRNRGSQCVGPVSSKDPACSAIVGAPKMLDDVYPPELQIKDGFCKDLEARKDGEVLLDHFNVVRGTGAALEAVPYTAAYAEQMTSISEALVAAAGTVTDPKEAALVTYLNAAAASFKSNDWVPADEAWSKMNVDNSNWYVRVGPDEVYWEPCASKAGFHLSFAKINQGSRAWQSKLVPVQQEMEDLVAAKAGPPYKARKVTFHLPDFIDIVVNAGDDRDPLGATIGQSLPNWGPVSAEGRGRTVAMININSDADSRAARRSQMESLFDAESAKLYPDSTEPGLLSTILHEAAHNLGPAHEYKVDGKVDDVVFTGPIASMMEELKAQTAALFLLDFLRTKGVITDELARQSFADSIVWAFGHVSQGMYTSDKQRKAYGNLAAIHIGTLLDKAALTWDPNKVAANGTDNGAFTVHVDKLAAAAAAMMTEFGGIKARGDKAAAEKLIARFVDAETVVPHACADPCFCIGNRGHEQARQGARRDPAEGRRARQEQAVLRLSDGRRSAVGVALLLHGARSGLRRPEQSGDRESDARRPAP